MVLGLGGPAWAFENFRKFLIHLSTLQCPRRDTRLTRSSHVRRHRRASVRARAAGPPVSHRTRDGPCGDLVGISRCVSHVSVPAASVRSRDHARQPARPHRSFHQDMATGTALLPRAALHHMRVPFPPQPRPAKMPAAGTSELSGPSRSKREPHLPFPPHRRPAMSRDAGSRHVPAGTSDIAFHLVRRGSPTFLLIDPLHRAVDGAILQGHEPERRAEIAAQLEV